jgi:phosphoglycerol transferase MdoB-like AlkP superfamily enzyme
VRGIEGVVCGFPPSPSASVVKLGLSQGGFFSMAGLLSRQGYACDYLYGGMSAFDNMQSFLLATGFQQTITQEDFEHPDFVATWGVSDEDLFKRANETFVAHGDKPFFALVLSTSNHTPFEFPDGRIELYDKEKATRDNAVKYADHAIGELFRMARKESYFDHTLWVIVADHDTRAP